MSTSMGGVKGLWMVEKASRARDAIRRLFTDSEMVMLRSSEEEGGIGATGFS